MLREMIAADHLPDYRLEEEPGDIIRITPRRAAPVPRPPQIAPATFEAVRALAPGADAYALEAEWRGVWAATGAPRLRDPDRAFLGWVKKRV